MQHTTQLRQNHHEQVVVHDRGMPREDERILATVPSQTHVETYKDNLHPELYRQALKSMLATPEIESHLDIITASLIVTVFGGWLAGKMMRTRAFFFAIDLVLFFVCLVLAGFLVGVMLGENILPAETIPILLFVATGILLLIIGVVLASLIFGATRHRKLPTKDNTREIVVPVRQEVYTHYADRRKMYSKRSTNHA